MEFPSPLPGYLHFNCPVCYEILLRDPHLVSCCGRHFCGRCLLEAGHSCPLCKSKVFQSIVDKNHGRALSSLKVYCTRKEKGCTWEGELGKLMGHTSADGDCEYSVVACIYQCGAIMVHSLLKEHEESRCPKRPITCQYCNQYVSTWEDVTTKHYNECPEVELPCVNRCEESIERKNVSKHSTTCPLKVVKCEYVHCGCRWTGRQKDSVNHMKTGSIDHSRIITLYFTKQLQKQQEISNSLSKELKKQGDEIKLLKETVKKHDQRIKSVSGELSKSKKKLAQLTAQVSSYKASRNKLLVTSSHISEDVHCDDEEQRPDTSLSSSLLPTFGPPKQCRVFVPANRSLIATGGIVKSPTFLVGDPEYAMQLHIYPGGYGTGKGSHISILLQLVPAVGDELRKWPYTGSVIVGVCSEMNGVYEFEIHFNSSVPLIARLRPNEVICNPGIRIERFISHSDAFEQKAFAIFYIENAHDVMVA